MFQPRVKDGSCITRRDGFSFGFNTLRKPESPDPVSFQGSDDLPVFLVCTAGQKQERENTILFRAPDETGAGVLSCFRANPHGTGRAGTGHRFIGHGQGTSSDRGRERKVFRAPELREPPARIVAGNAAIRDYGKDSQGVPCHARIAVYVLHMTNNGASR